MRHAYLIIAHNQFELLKLLLKCLDHPQNDFYIHIDKKVKTVDFEDIKSVVKYSGLTFTDRVSIRWGGFSQVESELVLMKSAIKGRYDYYHLLSGVDLPLKTSEQILRFFEENNGTEFIHFSNMSYCKSDNVIRRVKYYYPFQEIFGKEEGIYYYISRFMLKIQRLLKVNRLKNCNMEISCGAQWFSITGNLASYVVENEKKIKCLCKNGFCVDEIFLQTLVYNSDFIKKVYKFNDNEDYISSMRYIDWKRGTPYTFQKEDYEELINSDYLFARKFDIISNPEICYSIAEYVTLKKKD